MSNPIPNRLGLNLFWHHFWYSDNRYSMAVQQDALLQFLVESYLKYGSNVQTNLFWNAYWFKTTPYQRVSFVSKYYRWASIVNKVFHTSTLYRFRLTGEHLISARFSLLRFNSWVILNFFWFQPNKAKRRQRLMSDVQEHLSIQFKRTFSQNQFLRLKSILYYKNSANISSIVPYDF